MQYRAHYLLVRLLDGLPLAGLLALDQLGLVQLSVHSQGFQLGEESYIVVTTVLYT